MNNGKELCYSPDLVTRRFVLFFVVFLVFFLNYREMFAAETIADDLNRVVTLNDLPPGYQQIGAINARTFSSFFEATIDFKPQRTYTSLIQVRLKRYNSAAGTFNATRFLEKDIRAANAAAELARLAEGHDNLSRTMSITRKRFLLLKEDYEEDLVFIDNLVAQMLDNLKRSIPAATTNQQRFRINDPQPPIDLDLATEIMSGLTGENKYDIPSLQVKVTEVKFYEGGIDAVPVKQRIYGNRFSRASARVVWWDINLAYPDPEKRIDFSVEAVCFRPDGTVLNRQLQNYFIQSSCTTSLHSMGFGGHAPGTWTPGTYRVELFVSGKQVGGGSFEITTE